MTSELRPAAWLYSGGDDEPIASEIRWPAGVVSAQCWTETPLYTLEAVRAEQAAEVERLTLTVRKLQGHQAALESYLREIRDKPVARSSDAWKRHCLKLQAIAAEALGDVA